MRYFTYIADKSFKTAPNGERVFYQGGPWTRPYVIPNAATEQRLYWKQVWTLRIMLGGIIIGMPAVILLAPSALNNSIHSLIFIAAAAALSWTVTRLVFARDLRTLRRSEARLPLKSFYGDIAGTRGTILGVAACLMFVALGAWMVASGQSVVIGAFNIIFFGLCAVAWTYALVLKRGKAASAGSQG